MSNKINGLIFQAESTIKRYSSEYQVEVNISSPWESACVYVYVTWCRGEDLRTSDMHAMCKKQSIVANTFRRSGNHLPSLTGEYAYVYAMGYVSLYLFYLYSLQLYVPPVKY